MTLLQIQKLLLQYLAFPLVHILDIVHIFNLAFFQLLEIESGFAILMLWAVGGLIAVCGAMTYAELGAAMPRSGGEYNFLSRIYHPAAGFVSGWTSATIGFAGPTALAAMTFAAYGTSIMPNPPPGWVEKLLAAGLVRRRSAALRRRVWARGCRRVGAWGSRTTWAAPALTSG